MTDYEDGFYWVKWDVEVGWDVASVSEGVFTITGDHSHWEASDFIDIGPKLTPPSEETE